MNLAWKKKSYFCFHQSLIFRRKHGSRVRRSCFSNRSIAEALVLSGATGKWLWHSGLWAALLMEMLQSLTLWRSDYSLQVCQTRRTGLAFPSPLFLANIFVVRGGKIRRVFLGNIPGLSFWASIIIFSLVNCQAFSLLLHRQVYLWRLQLLVWSGCKSKA